jgi:D-ribose pyranase
MTMRETGTLNRDISDVLSTLGHTDEMIVCDAGFAIPQGVRTIDIALAKDKPTVLELLTELKEHFSVEKVVVADATRNVSPTRFHAIQDVFGDNVPVEVIPLAEFKLRARGVKAVVRTGDFTAYSNVLLISAGGGRWYLEQSDGK